MNPTLTMGSPPAWHPGILAPLLIPSLLLPPSQPPVLTFWHPPTLGLVVQNFPVLAAAPLISALAPFNPGHGNLKC
ncbi:hypothetical protein E2C01_059311 [Portunus trituberculatus]|uniref:Uncharacterized protein n=1 Tax=Portunus trituberculatus TaxID=210409 RepID=A0A5B7GXM8_PORTR|nr:hypothetical protein [Portunus trituberculatus]